MLPAGLAALSDAWPQPSERAKALGAWSSISAVATALGPAVGGLLVAALSWRAGFWINVPLCLVAAWGTWRQLRPAVSASSQEQDGPAEGAPVTVRKMALVGSVAAAAI